MRQLKVIKGNKKSINYKDIYAKIFDGTLERYGNTEDKDILKKLSYYGVKVVNEISKDKLSYEQILKLFELIEVVKVAISLLTPNELITVFPIDKKYNGDRYQVKDYFYTMKELQNIGMDNMIMSKVEHLLWDYENKEINRFLVNDISIVSEINKIETGKGLMEIWAEENGISTYKLCKDETTNAEYLYDSRTGKTVPVKKNIPKYLSIVK